MGLFNLCFFWLLLISVSSTNACDRCLHQSKVAFFSTHASLSSGACGYGSSVSSLHGSHPVAAVGSIYKSGSGYGSTWPNPSQLGSTADLLGSVSRHRQLSRLVNSVKRAAFGWSSGLVQPGQLSGQTQSTQNPECHRCTLANSCSWNDTTESR
ncbi:hypothetical protein Hdeb2414_s0008g00294541 [Helianthus debilis subsp. tardiflorus]